MYALKSIIVHLDGTERAAERLVLARDLAHAHRAELRSVLAIDRRFIPLPVPEAGEMPAAPLLDELDPRHIERAQVAYERHIGGGPLRPGLEVATEQSALAAMVRRARLTDLVVFGRATGHRLKQVLKPGAALVMTLAMVSLAGVPATAGFLGALAHQFEPGVGVSTLSSAPSPPAAVLVLEPVAARTQHRHRFIRPTGAEIARRPDDAQCQFRIGDHLAGEGARFAGREFRAGHGPVR